MCSRSLLFFGRDRVAKLQETQRPRQKDRATEWWLRQNRPNGLLGTEAMIDQYNNHSNWSDRSFLASIAGSVLREIGQNAWVLPEREESPQPACEQLTIR